MSLVPGTHGRIAADPVRIRLVAAAAAAATMCAGLGLRAVAGGDVAK
ncbi:hypothetical protein ACIBEA_15445 [Streptomyces sp. NPDC051555]